MEICNCFHLVVVNNILLSMSSFSEFCTFENNYHDGQGCMVLVVKFLSMLAFLKS
jgi:hypothetical protein